MRVDGDALRVKVIGEGGNLGLTQRGRIEFARKAGGKVNTDALDNSAGVDCSDHEVNIKILLDHLVIDGKLDREQRNELLAEMTDEVGALVLRRQLPAERRARGQPGARRADAVGARAAGGRRWSRAGALTASWRRCRRDRSSASWTRRARA